MDAFGSWIWLRRAALAALLAAALPSAAFASNASVVVDPPDPTVYDDVAVRVWYPGAPFVFTHSHSIVGNAITITLVQDDTSFIPNQPFTFSEPLGRLAGGTYAVVVNLVDGGGQTEVRTFTLFVDPALPPDAVDAIEFHHAALDHWFVTSVTREIADLDTGVHSGWSRTGQSFKVYRYALPGTVPVCRYYITPQWGDSHFFSAAADECAALDLVNQNAYRTGYLGIPRYFRETSRAFFVFLPDRVTGVCPADTVTVHRFWNGRADSNHRYATDAAVVATMRTAGYIAEGYGPDAVVMCAPR